MPLRVRKLAPYFHGQAVIDGKVKEINLDDFKGRYLVLLFYPMDFTYVSPTEILAFSDRAQEFCHYNCSIVGISTDSEFTHLAWMRLSKDDGGLGGVINIALLSDKSMKISRDYGVLDRDIGISHRGLYIIDQKGIIRHITMNDLEVGRSVEETLRLLKAFQFTDKYIKVCPVDWKPGDRGLRPDPMQTERYFEGYFGISRGKSNVQINTDQQDENTSIEDKYSIKKAIKEERVVKSVYNPSNEISMPKTMAIDKEIVSEASQQKTPPNLYGKEMFNNALEDLLIDRRNGKIAENVSTDGKDYSVNRSSNATNQSGFQTVEHNLKVNEDIVGRPNTAKRNRNYKLYSTTVPISKALRNEQKVLTSDIQTTSKSDTTQRYNYTKAQEMEKQLRKDPKAHLEDLQLKQYIYSYYNTSNENVNQNKNPIILRNNSSDKPYRYELINDDILKYNDRITKGIELKTKQTNDDKREDSNFNKSTTRKSKVGSKEVENVKDMTYHPLNDVLNIRPVNFNNNSSASNMDYRTSVQRPIKPMDRKANSDRPETVQQFPNNQEDQFDESTKYPKSNQYKRQQEHPSSDYTPHVRGQSNMTSQNSREDKGQYRRINKNHPASLNEPPNQYRSNQKVVSKNLESSSQIVLDAKVLKSSLKRTTATSRQNNFNTVRQVGNYGTKIMKPVFAVPPQYTGENSKFSYDYSEVGGRGKGRSDGGRNNKRWGGKASSLPEDVNDEMNYGHLVI